MSLQKGISNYQLPSLNAQLPASEDKEETRNGGVSLLFLKGLLPSFLCQF